MERQFIIPMCAFNQTSISKCETWWRVGVKTVVLATRNEFSAQVQIDKPASLMVEKGKLAL